MTKNEELLDFAEQRGHRVYYADMPEAKSLSVQCEVCYIGIDPYLSVAEETVCLAHELGHCEYGGFYTRYASDTRGKSERKARKWSYLRLVPIPEIQVAISKGVVEVWDLADYFGVTDRFMCEALAYYHEALCFDFATSK